MATQAHCAFCFECLSAAFERRKPPSLAQVEELWEQYQVSLSGENVNDEPETEEDETDNKTDNPIRPAAISRLLNHEDSSAGSSSSSLPSTNSAGSSNQHSADNSSSGNTTPASSNSSLRSKLSPFSRRRKSREAVSNQQYPLFVKWITVSRSSSRGGGPDKILRGCIGTFSPQNLETGLKTYALTSAFEDERFTPIPPTQLPRLDVQVTLLTDFSSPTTDPMAWNLGQHGLRIAFAHRGMRLGSTYLPDVAPEQGWNKEETVVSLMRKAGWSGSDWRKAWRDGEGTLITYEGNAKVLSYAEWMAWKDWVAAAKNRNGVA